LDAKGKLVRLLRIQELAVEIAGSQQVVDSAPARLEEIETRFRERNAEYVAVRDRHDELDRDQRHRSGELAGLEQRREKYMADLMGVQNQREYAAMLKEIDSVKAEIAGHEEAILKDMEAIEQLKGELANHEEHIQQEREMVRRQREEIEAEAERARATAARLVAERERIESELPQRLVTTIRGLETNRQGIFLSKAENGTCLSCFVRVRPQAFQEIKQATVLHTCGNCRRYLYHEPSLKPAEAETKSGESAAGPRSSSSNVEAVNGGAV